MTVSFLDFDVEDPDVQDVGHLFGNSHHVLQVCWDEVSSHGVNEDPIRDKVQAQENLRQDVDYDSEAIYEGMQGYTPCWLCWTGCTSLTRLRKDAYRWCPSPLLKSCTDKWDRSTRLASWCSGWYRREKLPGWGSAVNGSEPGERCL